MLVTSRQPDVAEKLKRPKEEIEDKEMPPHSVFGRVAEALGRGYAMSQFILKDYPSAVHVLVVAPFELRLRRTMSDLKMDANSAKKEIERFDGSRRAFAKRYFEAELMDPVHYDVVVNTKNLTFEDATAVVIGVLRLAENTASKRRPT